MTSPLSAAVREFVGRSPTLATRDRDGLEGAGEWDSPEHVDVEEVKDRFAEFDELVQGGRIQLPLHEPNTAELTGEYVIYSNSTVIPCYAYEDSVEGLKRIDTDDIGDTRLGWQLRFWSSEYEPPETPSYAGEEKETEQTELTEIAGDGGQANQANSDLFDRLEASIENEIEAERQTRREAYQRLPFGSFRGQYGGVSDVTPKSRMDMYKGTIYTASANTSFAGGDIYPGNEILVDADMRSPTRSEEPDDALPAEAVVEDVEGDYIEFILLTERCHEAAPDMLQRAYETPDASLTLAPLYNPVPYDRERDAINHVREADAKRRVLVGESNAEPEHEKVDAEFPDLNESQSEAARRAIAADDFALIHGPPGTGKTRTLVEIIKQLTEEGKRVLACAHSNQATDNLLVGSSTKDMPDTSSLHYETFGNVVQMARVGSGSSSELVQERYAGNNPDKANVVGATMNAASQFDDDEFDVAVIDEASQASIPATLIPFTKAEKIVLAGDHKQLPPYTAVEREQKEMAISLYEHLIDVYGEDVATMLRTQYRMNEMIAEFPNKQFYGNRLKTADANRNWVIDDFDPVKAVQVNGEEQPALGHSYMNAAEAEAVADEVDTLLSHGVDEGDIGVITPYTGQISEIEEQLASSGAEGIKVDTIDSFQGSEREAIVVSFVRANDGHQIGFLGHPEEGFRRLNVAMTRAKKRLVLIGDWDTLSGGSEPIEPYASLRQWLIDNGLLETGLERVA